jgi:hypothetical protein
MWLQADPFPAKVNVALRGKRTSLSSAAHHASHASPKGLGENSGRAGNHARQPVGPRRRQAGRLVSWRDSETLVLALDALLPWPGPSARVTDIASSLPPQQHLRAAMSKSRATEAAALPPLLQLRRLRKRVCAARGALCLAHGCVVVCTSASGHVGLWLCGCGFLLGLAAVLASSLVSWANRATQPDVRKGACVPSDAPCQSIVRRPTRSLTQTAEPSVASPISSPPPDGGLGRQSLLTWKAGAGANGGRGRSAWGPRRGTEPRGRPQPQPASARLHTLSCNSATSALRRRAQRLGPARGPATAR